ncbi:IPTL-CTERM sorting domain-containing protein [Ottowia thiooxydans]|uniref:IPTL-CTERM sorting domain-containing protein n=1 Tax=Ottowia thiooxydans TaxID=219182 RepID=UPI0004192A76|nr:IPTL-CTERM sorting domain-containing protein [Ottowia thiooxydans]
MLLAGTLDQFGGAPHERLARLDLSTNDVDASFNNLSVSHAGYVAYDAFPISSSSVMVGGWFARVDQAQRNGLALIIETNGTPQAPQITQAVPGNSQIVLTITPSANFGDSPITGYDVTCTPNGPGSAVSVVNAASPVLVSGLTNGAPFDCAARAVNVRGSGPASAAIEATPAAQGPTPSPSASVTTVPTLSEWGMVILCLGCAAIGLGTLRRTSPH